MGAGWVCEQASHSLVIFNVASGSVVGRAAAAGDTGFPVQHIGEEEQEERKKKALSNEARWPAYFNLIGSVKFLFGVWESVWAVKTVC